MIRLDVSQIHKNLKDPDRCFDLNIPCFEVKSGEKVAIIGATGSGKTTAMDILAMASQPDKCERFALAVGDKSYDLKQIATKPQKCARIRASFFGYVMQRSPLFPFLSVRENVTLQQLVAKRPDPAFIDVLLDRLGLTMIAGAFPSEISQGQKQRTAIARSLSHRPSVILCDEPTGALDPKTARQCLETIDWAAVQTGAALIMITHDWELAKACGFEFCSIQTCSLGKSHMAGELERRSCAAGPAKTRRGGDLSLGLSKQGSGSLVGGAR
ncbi:ABC transporter ATP-binding protein [Cohaesibacter celericrescens]|uniref:ABC transporter domain-containing protein n=1 Tax=Cohaesibacter celericrescens TaxID=2067669 RepID=A0A2N5XUK2_9HYPH|nr:ABC transporter ATP-binding protein [Cohaesibacter celericrescens]PLW78196.1 hypothetical protein C0081_06020 [Cohaesibacter celericrescens]